MHKNPRARVFLLLLLFSVFFPFLLFEAVKPHKRAEIEIDARSQLVFFSFVISPVDADDAAVVIMLRYIPFQASSSSGCRRNSKHATKHSLNVH